MVCPHRLGPTRQVGFPSRSRCACNIYIYMYLSSVFHYISYHRFSFSYIALGDRFSGPESCVMISCTYIYLHSNVQNTSRHVSVGCTNAQSIILYVMMGATSIRGTIIDRFRLLTRKWSLSHADWQWLKLEKYE